MGLFYVNRARLKPATGMETRPQALNFTSLWRRFRARRRMYPLLPANINFPTTFRALRNRYATAETYRPSICCSGVASRNLSLARRCAAAACDPNASDVPCRKQSQPLPCNIYYTCVEKTPGKAPGDSFCGFVGIEREWGWRMEHSRRKHDEQAPVSSHFVCPKIAQPPPIKRRKLGSVDISIIQALDFKSLRRRLRAILLSE